MEWPRALHVQQAETVQLLHSGVRQEVVYTELLPDTSLTSGPFKFEVTGDKWAVPYEARVDSKRHLRYSCAGPTEIKVVRLQDNGLTLVLDGDRVIADDLLYQPTPREIPSTVHTSLRATGRQPTSESNRRPKTTYRRRFSTQPSRLASPKLPPGTSSLTAPARSPTSWP